MSSKYGYVAVSCIAKFSGQRDRALDADVRVDVVELREAAEEAKPDGGDGLAQRRDVLFVLEIIDGIPVSKSHYPLIDHGLPIEKPERLQFVDRPPRNGFVAQFPNSVAPIRGDLRHDG